MLNGEINPGFEKFDELTDLLKNFTECSLTECRRARLLASKDGELGDAEKIRERYEEKYRKPFNYSSSLAIFNIVHDNNGNWIAFLVSDSLTVSTDRFYYGKEHDWQTRLVDVVIEAYGLEPTDDLRKHIWLTV